MNMPLIMKHSQLLDKKTDRLTADGFWIAARWEPFYSIGNRLRATWLVFTGKADAFIWDID